MKLVQNATLDPLILPKMKILEKELGIVSGQKTAFQLFIFRLVQEEVKLSEAFIVELLKQVILFFQKEWSAQVSPPIPQYLVEHQRVDLFNIVCDYIKF